MIPTLKSNVADFWKWFESRSEDFYQVIENGKCDELEAEVSSAMDRWLPNMAWEFGSGEAADSHSLTLSGEGILDKQFVAEYWRRSAPVLQNWCFYASRRASNMTEFLIEMGGRTFNSKALWVSTFLDNNAEQLDLMVWHPEFSVLEDRDRWGVLFILLDGILGEYGTQNWVGEIKVGDSRLQDAMPLSELPEFIAKVELETGWKKFKPIDTFTSYSRKEPRLDELRADVVAGSARHFKLIRQYGGPEEAVSHPLPDFCVDYIFICIPAEFLPIGQEVQARGEIEDALIGALEPTLGLSLGGATGQRFGYIDFMLFDGQNSLDVVKKTLRNLNLPRETQIRYFTSDKAHLVETIG